MAAPAVYYPEPQTIKTIAGSAPGYGLDPAAVLAVAAQEGLTGAITGVGGLGDYGTFTSGGVFVPEKPGTPGGEYTSFGPFQLHLGGAYSTAEAKAGAPKVPLTGATSDQVAAAQAWATSTRGINWTLSQIASSAGGQTGGQAIQSIASWEGSTNPAGQASNAEASYPAWQQFLKNPTAGPFPGEQAQPNAPGATPGGIPVGPGAVGQGTDAQLGICNRDGSSFGGCFCGITDTGGGVTGAIKKYTGVGIAANFFTEATPCLAEWAYGWLQRVGLLLAAAGLALLGLYLVARDAGAAPSLAPSLSGT